MGIEGSRGTSSVKSAIQRKRDQFRRLMCEGLEQRLLMAADGPRLLSIAPNAGEILSVTRDNVLNESPRELVFRFDSDVSKESLANGIQIFRSGGDNAFGTAVNAANPNADVRIVPSFLDFGESNRIVIARFSQALEDDLYSVQVLGTGSATPITNAAGQTLQTRISGTSRDSYQFDLELGTKIVAVVPQPVVRQLDGTLNQLRDVIEVYFNDSELYAQPATTLPPGAGTNPAVVDPAHYKLILTKDTVSPNDDLVIEPVSITYDPLAKKATLKFGQTIDTLMGANGEGTFRLRVGSTSSVANETINIAPSIQAAVDPGATLDLARPINGGTGALSGSYSTVISQEIRNTSGMVGIDFPGGNLEPGHRDIQDESHMNGVDTSNQIAVRYYSFMDNQSYGTDVQGRPVFSSITPEQRARVREVFEFYSAQFGIDFVERFGTRDGGDIAVVVGDMAPRGRVSGPGGVAGVASNNLAIMDGAETWDNSFGYGSNTGGSFFDVAMHEIGHLLGLGHAYDLPAGTIMGDGHPLSRGANPLEQIFPSSNDLVHGQRLFRPDNKDVDLYRFVIPESQAGEVRIETVAERLNNSSNLDTHLTLLSRDANGKLFIVSANNNYFSDDSFINVDLGPGEYFVAVTGKGNEDFNVESSGTGSGAVSQGAYELRFDFKSSTLGHLSEQTAGSNAFGSKLDGDSDGVAGGDFNFWFRAVSPYTNNAAPTADGVARTLYVDKAFTGINSYGSIASPFKTISAATTAAQPGDIIRIVGDTRTSENLTDERAYEIGTGGSANGVLSDGASLQVPKGVTLMIDAGAIFKFAGSGILVGSNDSTTDRSNAAIQVLGTPQFPVYMTSYADQTLGVDTNPLITSPNPSDWGGIEIRNNFDRAQGRFDREREGIFLNTISNADIRFGGGLVGVGANARIVSPIDLSEARPLILNNTISRSGSAAISADPNSFEETLFTEPRYQNVGAFVPDYSRVGPDIRSNTVTNNSINGLFIKIETTSGGGLQTLSVPGRIDDSEITIVLGENLIIEGTPGGALSEADRPNVAILSLTPSVAPAGQGFTAAGSADYVITYVDKFGQESLPSIVKSTNVVAGQQVLLANIPVATLDYVARKIYRRDNGALDANNQPLYKLVANLNRDESAYLDRGRTIQGTLQTQGLGQVNRARRDASLVIDPGVVLKALGGRIEVGIGATFLAEGTQSNPIIFTSRLDDRYGAGGTMDTNNDGSSQGTAGDWAGIISRHLGELSLDNTIVSFGGGNSRVPGGFASFNAIEVHQSVARITNSLIENNAFGTQMRGTTNRDGRGINDEAAIFVLASQPVIINNIIRNNSMGTGTPALSTAAISIDANSLNFASVQDHGRSTGTNQRINTGVGNYGPLISENRLGGNAINGMNVRGATLTTESIWDDTDIVHVLQSEIVVPDLHTYGGLRLTSRADESLVVKLQGTNAGFTASGRPLDITDRVGGSLQVIGSPGFPVVLTSLADDTIGAGFDYLGRSMVDTTNDQGGTSPQAGQWRSVRFETFANDRNVEQLYERESDLLASTGSNDVPTQAENLGSLAPSLSGGDENVRLGFTVTGSIATPADLDVYQFSGSAGTQIWIDIDQSSLTLDSVVELVDANGQIIVLSNNSIQESVNRSVTYFNPALISENSVNPMDQQWNADQYTFVDAAVDHLATNPMDAGFRVALPGSAGTVNNYYIRVRSSNLSPVPDSNGQSRNDPNRLTNPALVREGVTVGQYKLQVRLQQRQEYSGSTVRFADVRYATTAIEALGLPHHSPLLGDFAEANPNESSNEFQPQALGNLIATDRASLSIAGQFANNDDIDFYSLSVAREATQQVPGAIDHNISVVFDVDYADGLGRANTQLWVFDDTMRLVLMADDSNILDDQAAPERGTDAGDLTRGSFGTRDAYIGPFELPKGDYYVAVSNKRISHVATRQFSDASAGANALVRVEPIDSVIRISEDRFDTLNRSSVATPAIQTSFDTTSPVQFNLSDVTLFATNGRNVQFVNPLTGVTEAIYSTNGTSAVNFGPNTNSLMDIAVAPNGHGVAFQQNTGSRTDANSGTFVGLDLGNGAPTTVASGLQTFSTRMVTPVANPPTYQVVQTPVGNGTPGVGMVFDGITFSSQFETDHVGSLWGVARRGDGQSGFQPNIGGDNNDTATGVGSAGISKNILYRLSASGTNVGQALSPAGASRAGVRTALGAGTNVVETGYFVKSAGNLTGTGVGTTGNSRVSGWVDADGTVTGLATVRVGNSATFRYYAVTNAGELMSLSINNDSQAQVWSDQYTVILDSNGTPLNFTGLTVGPRNLNDGFDYSQMLFGTTANGRLYAFNTSGVLQPIFTGGNVFTTLGGGAVTGISFSSLDTNLWHLSRHNEAEAGHGRVGTFNNSNDSQTGENQSFRFGYANQDAGLRTQSGNYSGVYDVASQYNTIAAPGGARGAIESNVIDLVDYSANDLPTLYFNYRLETQNSNSGIGDNAPALDAFRVYASTDNGDWVLLATNNTPSDAITNGDNIRSDFAAGRLTNGSDEFDISNSGLQTLNEDAYGRPRLTSELFDNQGWRQAKVSLATFAGMKNVKIRFEFSTGGDFRTLARVGNNLVPDSTRNGIEFTAVSGVNFISSTGNTTSSFNYDSRRFEFDLGLQINAPSGSSIQEGNTLNINGEIFTFTNSGGANTIPFTSGSSSQGIANQISTALFNAGYSVFQHPGLQSVLTVSAKNAVPLPAGATYTVTGLPASVIGDRPGVAPGSVAIPIDVAMSATAVRDAVRSALAASLNVPGQEGNINTFRVRDETILLHSSTLKSITNSSPMILNDGRIGDAFGSMDGGTGTSSLYRASFAAQQNNVQGVQLDDIIIGFAERGETVFNAPIDSTNFSLTPYYAPQIIAGQPRANEIETGKYQLEIRAAADYGVNPSTGRMNLIRSFDTNDRLSTTVMLDFASFDWNNEEFPDFAIRDGETFTLSDGTNVAKFEFDVTVGTGDSSAGVTSGNIPVPITTTMSGADVVRALRDAINSTAAQAIIKVTASTGGEMKNGFSDIMPATSTKLYLHGTVAGNLHGSFVQDFGGLGVTFYGLETSFGEDLGDSNRLREQGQFIISSTVVRNSANYGINIDAALQNQSELSPTIGARPYPGAVRNLVATTNTNLAPGVVLINNVIYSNAAGGINVSGDVATDNGRPPVTLARVLNNTLYGNGVGVGINVSEGANPYLLNNVVASFSTGIAVSANSSGTIAGGNLYKQNGTNSTGLTQSFEVLLGADDPLFTDPVNGRFYLSALSKAIDSSLASLESRADIDQVKSAVGLPSSSLLAPTRDIFGLLRSDDPLVNTPAGLGQNVFIDRGAIDRVDFEGPQAIIIAPLDNDANGVDGDKTSTVLQIANGQYDYFDILLDESSGTGVDPQWITDESVIITENGRRLVPKSDYILGYSASSRTVRLTPLAGFWREDSVYEVTLVNQQSYRIDVPLGANISDGQTIEFLVDSTNIRLEFDTNGTIEPDAIAIPVTATMDQATVLGAIYKALQSAEIVSGGAKSYVLSRETILVTGVSSLETGPVRLETSIPPIRDIAGNNLTANRPSSLTQFTIVMPEVRLDFGDAIERTGTGANSGTFVIDNGARHAILPSDVPSLLLGKHVDADANGIISNGADADDHDSLFTLSTGLPFTAGDAGPARFEVTGTSSLANVTLTIRDNANGQVVFQFTNGNTAIPAGVVRVNIQGLTTPAAVATQLAIVVYQQGIETGRLLNMQSVAAGNFVSFGGTHDHQFSLSTGASGIRRHLSGDMTFSVRATGLSDGQSFTINDGSGRQVVFQVVDTALATPSQLGEDAIAVRVNVSGPVAERFSDQQVTEAFRDAINGAIRNLTLRLPEVVSIENRLVIQADDEDGVSFSGVFNEKSAPVVVNVVASAAGYLDAWVDWNQDNDFSDENEQVIRSIPVVAGLNTLEIVTPVGATTGFTSARFRLSTTGGLAPTGMAIGGEVEDYRIEILDGDPPIAVNDPATPAAEYRVLEDQVLNVSVVNGLLANDIAAKPIWVVDSVPSTVSIDPLVAPQHGTLELIVETTGEHAGKALGAFRYTPNRNFSGTDSFVYHIRDARMTSMAPATVFINVLPINDSPVGVNDEITITEDNGDVLLAPGTSVTWSGDLFTANDIRGRHSDDAVATDEATQKLTVTAASFVTAQRPGETITVDPATNKITYTPGMHYNQDIAGPIVVRLTIVDDGVDGQISGTDQQNVDPTLVAAPRTTTSLLTIHISPVNDQPIFQLSTNLLTEVEDPNPSDRVHNIVRNVAAGPAGATDELASQVVEEFSIKITATHPDPESLFSVLPHIVGTGANRQLQYTLAPDVNWILAGGNATNEDNLGDIHLEITAIDDGLDAPEGNNNKSAVQTLTIRIQPVNDAPNFDVVTQEININEDAPLQILPAFYTNVVAGPETAIDELEGSDDAQAVTMSMSIHPQAAQFFVVPPTLNAAGDLQFQLRPDVNSNFATTLGIPDLFDITITATDDGFENGVSTPRTLSKVIKLNIAPINDAPFFSTDRAQVIVNEDQGVVQIDGFAQELRPAFLLVGGNLSAIDEQGQSLEFVVTVGNQTLFSELPTIDSNGRLSFRTAPDQNGTSVVTARLTDGGAASPAPNNNVGPIVTFTIVVNAVNDAPEFTIPSQVTVEEDAGVVSLNGFATDIRPGPETALDENRQTISFTLVKYDANLFEIAPTLQNDGTLSFKTRADVNSSTPGIDRVVEFRLNDSGAQTPAPNTNQSLVRSFTLNITPVNDPPVPDIHEVNAVEDTALTIVAANVLQGDAAGPADEVAAGQTLRITQVEATSELGGTVTSVMENGRVISIRYTPPANAVGDDFIRYVVTDNGSPERSATGVIHVTIAPVNDAPQFTAGPNLTLLEDAAPYSATWATNVLAGPNNAADEWTEPDAQEVSFILTPRTAGFFAVQPAIDSAGVLTFQLAKDVNGSVVVEVVAEDNGARGAGHQFRSATHLLTIAITPLNDPPGFVLGDDITLAEDSGPYSSVFVTNITGAEGQNNVPPTGGDEPRGNVHFEVTTNNSAMFSVQPAIDANGRLVFTPAEDAFGIVEVYVVGVDDGASTAPNSNRSAPKTFSIVLESANDPPFAVHDRYSTDEDTQITISAPGVLANDRDVDLPNDTLTVVVPTTPIVSRLGANVVIHEDGSFSYDPSNAQQIQRLGENEEVVDTFTYSIQDAAGTLSNVGTVSITVSGFNDAPVAVDDAFQISASIATPLNVLANDTDVDSTIDVRTVEVGRLPANGSVEILPSGRIEFRPNPNFAGQDSFTYKFRDANGLVSNEATVSVYSSVQPVAGSDTFSVPRGRPTVLDILRNDYDPDTLGGIDPSSVRIAQAPTTGTATVEANGQITYTPPDGFSGTATFQYFVSDLSGQPSNVAVVTVRVLGSQHQNPQNYLDVNADGFISPIDVLIIVNDINYRGTRYLGDDVAVPPYLDVNGNGSVDPLDALELINYLNNRGSAGAGGEGESVPANSVQDILPTSGLDTPSSVLEGDSQISWTPIDVEIMSSERYRQLAEDKWAEVQTEILNSAFESDLPAIVSGSPSGLNEESNAEDSDDWFAVLAAETTEEFEGVDSLLATDFWAER